MLDGVQAFLGAQALAYASWLDAPAFAYALWFILGALWAVLVCEYRAYRRRARMVAHIHLLESELMAAEDHYLSERTHSDRIRAELLDLLMAAQSSQAKKSREHHGFKTAAE